MSTTNVLAVNSLHAPGLGEEERSRRAAAGQRLLCYLLTIAAACGLAVAVILQVNTEPLFMSFYLRTISLLLAPCLCHWTLDLDPCMFSLRPLLRSAVQVVRPWYHVVPYGQLFLPLGTLD